MHLTLVVFGLATLVVAMWSWNEDPETGNVEKISAAVPEQEKKLTP